MIANVKFHVTRCHAVTLYKSVTHRIPCVPEGACFLRVASVFANLLETHHTSMFHLFNSSYSQFKERNFSSENSTLVYLYLKSIVPLFMT